MAGSLITFTPSGGTLQTLGDDANKLTIEFGDASLECLVQKTPRAGGATPYLKARGNTSGQFSFTSTKSYATIDDMITAFKTGLALTGLQGDLVLSRGTSTMTMAGATLQKVARAPGSEGVKLRLNYIFQITTVT